MTRACRKTAREKLARVRVVTGACLLLPREREHTHGDGGLDVQQTRAVAAALQTRHSKRHPSPPLRNPRLLAFF